MAKHKGPAAAGRVTSPDAVLTRSDLSLADVQFYYPREALPMAMEDFDPERDWALMRSGAEVWILQTWGWLRRLGHDFPLVDTVPARGVLIYANAHKRRVAAQLARGNAALLVGLRADRRPSWISDIEVVQNPLLENGRHLRYMPHWPQQGLLPRDAARGATIRCVGFKGHVQNLAPGFGSPAWREALRERGIDWQVRGGAEQDDQRRAEAWHDYRELDISLAIRASRRGRQLHMRKPPTKLYNAWRAGVPAILGPEAAYRALRQSPLDYIEAATPDEALAAIDRLRRDPVLYMAMVDNGRRRGGAYAPERIARRWLALIESDLLPAARQRPPRRRFDLPLAWLRSYAGRVAPV